MLSSRKGKGHRPSKVRLAAASSRMMELMESRMMFSAFTQGDIAVVQVGTNAATGALADTGTAAFIDEYTPAGALVQQIPLPTTSTAGGNQALVLGNNTSEGELNLSTDGKDLLLVGYDAAVGSQTAIDATASTTVNRTIGEITAAGSVNTATALTDLANGANVRGVTGSDAAGFWAAGQDTTAAPNFSAVRYVSSLGTSTTTSTPLTGGTLANARNVEIANGQLYFTQNKAAGSIIEALDGTSGSLQTPTSGTPTINALPGTSPTATPGLVATIAANTSAKTGSFFFAKVGSSTDFQINGTDSGYNTLYVADSDSTAGSTKSTPGITKYSWNSSTSAWVKDGTVGGPTMAFEGLTGSVSGTTVTLYGTVVNTQSEIVSVVDSSGFAGTLSATPTVIATLPASPGGTRGVPRDRLCAVRFNHPRSPRCHTATHRSIRNDRHQRDILCLRFWHADTHHRVVSEQHGGTRIIHAD